MGTIADGSLMSDVVDKPPSRNKRKIIMESSEVEGALVNNKNIKMEGTDESPSPPEKMKIFVNAMLILPVKVNTSGTLEDVKDQYCTMVAETVTHLSDYEFFFGGDYIKNGKKLIDYGVHDGSTVHMFIQAKSRRKIHIKTNCGKTFTLKVLKWDTIKRIKSMVRDVMTDRKNQQLDLAYGGKQLDDDCQPLAIYNVRRDSTLYAVFANEDRFEVKVTTLKNGIISIKVKLSYTIEDLKMMIESMLGIPVKDQRLFKAEELLADYRTMADYKVMNGTEIHLTS